MIDGGAFRLGKTAFAFCFKEAKLATTGGGDIEHNNFVGHVSAKMKTLIEKAGELISPFDEIDEAAAQIGNTSPKHLLKNNHDIAVSEAKTNRQLDLEHIFGFCDAFKK